MPNFIFIKRSRNFLNAFLHSIFNIILGFSSIAITALTGNPAIGLFFVLLSKWRMFAVRPYYWLTNIGANSVDLIVGTSFVLLALPTSGNTADFLPAHAILSLLYIAWLIFLKPKNSSTATEAQSLVAIFLGVNATTLHLFPISNFLATFTIFITIYFAIRHVLLQNDDTDFILVSTVFALIATELTWAAQFWLIIYSFENLGLFITQNAVLLTLTCFCLNRIYHSYLRHDNKLRPQEITSPILFTVILTLIMLLWFSKPIFNI